VIQTPRSRESHGATHFKRISLGEYAEDVIAEARAHYPSMTLARRF